MPIEKPPEPLDAPLPNVIGSSPAMREVYRLTRLVALTRVSVLLVGETGTGKELIARAIHQLGPRRDGPYVRINCGALSESLLESELFGHVKGAFTGAVDNKTGRFEAAHGGTIFLDEISSMTPKLQVKLLRVLQEREFERVGESKTIQVDVRLIAATNQSLEDEVEAGRFRDDLYYRVNVVPVHLPPLRERPEDIPALADFFLRRCASDDRRHAKTLTPGALRVLMEYNWPGNVRELEHDIARAVVLSQADELTEELLAAQLHGGRRLRLPSQRGAALDNAIERLVRAGLASANSHADLKLYERLVRGLERELIEQVLRECDGVQVKAAARLGINRNTLHKKMADFGLEDTEPKSPAPGDDH
jgi:transcriptional regulator with GAF, ATPase, and Fis domain